VACDIVGPWLTPRQPGNRVKTDRRDAKKTACAAPRRRALVRVGADTRAGPQGPVVLPRRPARRPHAGRHRVSKQLLRHGRRFEGKRGWTRAHQAGCATSGYATRTPSGRSSRCCVTSSRSTLSSPRSTQSSTRSRALSPGRIRCAGSVALRRGSRRARRAGLSGQRGRSLAQIPGNPLDLVVTGRRRSGRPVAVFTCKPRGFAPRGRSPHTREVAGSNPAAPMKDLQITGF
jgi:hypothetical protein